MKNRDIVEEKIEAALNDMENKKWITINKQKLYN